MSRPVFSRMMYEADYNPNVGRTINSTTDATEYSYPIALTDCEVWAAHFVWTGTPTSTVTLWATCMEKPSLTDDTDWVDVTGTLTMPAPAGSASKAMVNVGNTGAYQYRFKVVTASGSGTMKIYAHGKGK